MQPACQSQGVWFASGETKKAGSLPRITLDLGRGLTRKHADLLRLILELHLLQVLEVLLRLLAAVAEAGNGRAAEFGGVLLADALRCGSTGRDEHRRTEERQGILPEFALRFHQVREGRKSEHAVARLLVGRPGCEQDRLVEH